MPEHSRQALPKEKEEADCADKQPDPNHHVSDERQKFDVLRTLRAVAVTGTIFEACHEPLIETPASVDSRPYCSEDRSDARHRAQPVPCERPEELCA